MRRSPSNRVLGPREGETFSYAWGAHVVCFIMEGVLSCMQGRVACACSLWHPEMDPGRLCILVAFTCPVLLEAPAQGLPRISHACVQLLHVAEWSARRTRESGSVYRRAAGHLAQARSR